MIIVLTKVSVLQVRKMLLIIPTLEQTITVVVIYTLVCVSFTSAANFSHL